MGGRVKVYRWRAPAAKYNNFGDELTIPLLRKVFGIEAVPSRMAEARLIAAGSILDAWALRGRRRERLRGFLSFSRASDLHVWGSGFIKPDTSAEWPQRLHFHAVRGRMTADRVQRSVPVGDPGILTSLIVDRPATKSASVGLVLHQADWPSFRTDTVPASWKLISPEAPVEEVVASIASCELIVSSSLHGLITADSFGIPCVWARTNTRLFGGTDFKFHDYASARGTAFNTPLSYAAILGMSQEEVYELGSTPERSIGDWQCELIAAFPRDL
jgi:hypothetical protein